MQDFETEPSLAYEPQYVGERSRRSGEQLVADALDDIDRTRTRISKEIGAPADSAEVTQATDEALVYVAERTLQSPDASLDQLHDAIDDVAIETALEIDVGTSALKTPVVELEYGGYRDSVDDVVRRLHESHATLPNGHEAAPLVMKAVDELAGRSDSLIDAANPGGAIEYVKAPASAEAKTYGVADALAVIDPENTMSRDERESIERRVAQNPGEYAAVSRLITERYGDIEATGYDPALLRKQVLEIYGPYAANGMAQGRDVSEHYTGEVAKLFNGIEKYGPLTAELQNKLTSSSLDYRKREPERDDILNDLLIREWQGEALDPQAIKDQMRGIVGNLDKLKEDHPVIADTLRSLHYGYGAVNRLDAVASRIEYGAAMASVIDHMDVRPGDSVRHQRLLTQLNGDYTAEGAKTQADRILLAQELDGLNPGRSTEFWSDWTLNAKYTPQMLAELKDVATTPAFKRAVTMDRGGDSFILNDLCRNGQVPDPTELTSNLDMMELIGKDAQYSELAAAKRMLDTDQTALFDTVAPAFLPNRDRNGFLYDSPRAVGELIGSAKTAEARADLARDLEWYGTDTLPIAAFDAVKRFRVAAEAAGVPDSPTDIYKWVYGDPDRLTELSHGSANRYVTDKVLGRSGLSREEQAIFVRRSAELAEAMTGDFRLFVNINPDALTMVSEGGGTIKSTFDMEGTRQNRSEESAYSNQYMLMRSGVELALGIRAIGETDKHPVYGSCGYVGDGVPEGALGYGDIMLSFKLDEDLASRTTYSPEDSFHGADRLTQRDAQIIRVMKTAAGIGDAKTNEYVESQVRGGLDLSKVDAVYVTSEQQREGLPPGLREKAIVRPAGSERGYKATREKGLAESIAVLKDRRLAEEAAKRAAEPVASALWGEPDSQYADEAAFMESMGAF